MTVSTFRVLKGNTIHGPYSQEQLTKLANKGKLQLSDMVSIDGAPWIPLSQIWQQLSSTGAKQHSEIGYNNHNAAQSDLTSCHHNHTQSPGSNNSPSHINLSATSAVPTDISDNTGHSKNNNKWILFLSYMPSLFFILLKFGFTEIALSAKEICSQIIRIIVFLFAICKKRKQAIQCSKENLFPKDIISRIRIGIATVFIFITSFCIINYEKIAEFERDAARRHDENRKKQLIELWFGKPIGR